MKNILLLSVTFVGLSLPFAPLRANDADFEKHKQEALAHIDERIQKLNEHKGCVSGATTKEALKECRHKMKEWHLAEKAEHMEKRKERLERKAK